VTGKIKITENSSASISVLIEGENSLDAKNKAIALVEKHTKIVVEQLNGAVIIVRDAAMYQQREG